MAVLFSFTLFAAATLLFLVQPLAGKQLLPLVGGTPAAWNACLVFFQGVLLLGYVYADLLARLPVVGQRSVHALVLAVGLVAALYPTADPGLIPSESDTPVVGVLAYLAGFVGLPFFALSATAPLVQRWYAAATRRDPYFLYAASNAGSFAGLLGFPLLVEPALGLDDQWRVWVAALAGAFALIAACGVVSWVKAAPVPVESVQPIPPPTFSRLVKWAALAALPSSLLLGTTTHLTTDLAPIPLLWVVPLGLYLLSFVIVFSRWGEGARQRTSRLTAMVIVFQSLAMLIGATEPLALTGGLALLALLGVALLCHGELARNRPPEQHLTRFYLALSVGGVLGGLFNLLLAPLLFAHVGLLEYPLALVLAALVRPKPRAGLEALRLPRWDAVTVSAFALFSIGTVLLAPRLLGPVLDPAADSDVGRLVRGGVLFGVPACLAFALAARPLRFTVALAVLFVAGAVDPGPYGPPLTVERNFFGTVRVTRSPDGKLVRLVHGTTLHGQQWAGRTDPPEPLMYYHRSGPIGRLLRQMPAERRKSVGVIGLGCGAMAGYANPGDEWTFFEIDPAVARIAADTRHFTFLSSCKGQVKVVLGDARRRLTELPDASFDVLVLDAFSSDAIPIHLLTREAFALYVRKLRPRGVLAFHLSNRYLDLPPMVAALAADHDPPFVTRAYFDPSGDPSTGRFASMWAIVAAEDAVLKSSGADAMWDRVRPARRVWTDGFSDILSVWKRGDPAE